MMEGIIHSILSSCGDHRRGRFSRERSTFEFNPKRALDFLKAPCIAAYDWMCAAWGVIPFPVRALAALLFLITSMIDVAGRVEAHRGNGL